MKTKSLAVNYLIWLLQFLMLSMLYMPFLMDNDAAIYTVATLIFLIGILGGLFLKKISGNEKIANRLSGWFVIFIGSLLTSLTTYLIFIPLIIVLTKNTATGILVIVGFVTPAIWFVDYNQEN